MVNCSIESKRVKASLLSSRFLRIKIREILAYDLRAKSKILAGQQQLRSMIDNCEDYLKIGKKH